MLKKIIVICTGLGLGIFFGTWVIPKKNALNKIVSPLGVATQKNEVVGFLPYWLINSADKDYSKYLTTLTYFGLTLDGEGKITKLTSPTETEPGWYALNNGKVDSFFQIAKKNNLQLSLLVFSSDQETIDQIISNPVVNAQNLIAEVGPIMQEYNFTDLNIDIESVILASDSARKNFTTFVKEVKKNMTNQKLGTLTIDASPTVLIKNYLIDLQELKDTVDKIVFMTYDYHYPGSYVTGPVAPLNGVETEAEFDTEIAIKVALNSISPQKILLGIPLYGYEWETLGDTPRSAVIPGSGIAASNRRVEQLINSGSTLSAQLDIAGQEAYLIYKDSETNTFHQIFYPDKNSTAKKVQLAEKYDLGGIAAWALGYEGQTILEPLKEYK